MEYQVGTAVPSGQTRVELSRRVENHRVCLRSLLTAGSVIPERPSASTRLSILPPFLSRNLRQAAPCGPVTIRRRSSDNQKPALRCNSSTINAASASNPRFRASISTPTNPVTRKPSRFAAARPMQPWPPVRARSPLPLRLPNRFAAKTRECYGLRSAARSTAARITSSAPIRFSPAPTTPRARRHEADRPSRILRVGFPLAQCATALSEATHPQRRSCPAQGRERCLILPCIFLIVMRANAARSEVHLQFRAVGIPASSAALPSESRSPANSAIASSSFASGTVIRADSRTSAGISMFKVAGIARRVPCSILPRKAGDGTRMTRSFALRRDACGMSGSQVGAQRASP